MRVVADCQRASVNGQPESAAPVVVLVFVCGPAAVAWLVVAVRVDAVERVAIRAYTHVLQELREVVSPLVAHGDAATAVERELSIRLYIATLLSVSPCPILPRDRLGCAVSELAITSAAMVRHFWIVTRCAQQRQWQ
jgi:hypothetical protein